MGRAGPQPWNMSDTTTNSSWPSMNDSNESRRLGSYVDPYYDRSRHRYSPTIETIAFFSQCVYSLCSNSGVDLDICKLGVIESYETELHKKGDLCMMSVNGWIWIFRGTSNDDLDTSMTNWKYNLHVFGSEKVGGQSERMVHPGFLHQFNKLKSDVVGCEDSRCLFAGHSLGGAMAQIAWEYFGGASSRAYVISFASPVVYADRVDNCRYHRNVFRFFQEDDPAPVLIQKLRDWSWQDPLRHGHWGLEIYESTPRRRTIYRFRKFMPQVRWKRPCSEPVAASYLAVSGWVDVAYSAYKACWIASHDMVPNYFHLGMSFH